MADNRKIVKYWEQVALRNTELKQANEDLTEENLELRHKLGLLRADYDRLNKTIQELRPMIARASEQLKEIQSDADKLKTLVLNQQ